MFEKAHDTRTIANVYNCKNYLKKHIHTHTNNVRLIICVDVSLYHNINACVCVFVGMYIYVCVRVCWFICFFFVCCLLLADPKKTNTKKQIFWTYFFGCVYYDVSCFISWCYFQSNQKNIKQNENETKPKIEK